MGVPLAPSPPSPAASEGAGGRTCRVGPRRRLRLLTSAKAGTRPSGVALVAEEVGDGPGAERFVPRSRS